MSTNDVKTELGVQYSVRPPAAGDAEIRARHASNRAAWNEAAADYTADLEKTIAFLRSGGSNLHDIERRNLGNLREWCRTAIHLQCASGKDTLSLWNEGVGRVVGVDISDVHIANARRMSDALGAPATWHRCDILDTPSALDGTADLVYTGQGAMCWLHDLTRWGQVVFRLLKPGGMLHLFDDHPVTWLFNTESKELISTGLNYFKHAETSQGWPPSYLGDLEIPVEKQTPKYERLWTLSAIFAALRGAGLTIEHFGEHPDPYWDTFPNLDPRLKGRIPLTFSMVARKLGGGELRATQRVGRVRVCRGSGRRVPRSRGPASVSTLVSQAEWQLRRHGAPALRPV